MKQSIDGKVYNTETAKKLAHYWNGLGASDFGNLSEDLYITKKGKRTNINELLVREGHARWYDGGKREPWT